MVSAIWLAAWAFAEIFIGGMVLKGVLGNGKIEAPIPFIFIWIIGWTIGGVFAIYIFLWQIIGKEEIEITTYSITIYQVVLFFRRSKEYASEYINDLRTSPVGINEMYHRSRSLAIYGIGNGVIAFDYGAGTIRFGNGVEEAEGKQIIAEIQQKYPQYKKQM